MNLRQIFLNNIAQTSDSPLALEFPYAEGSFLYDKNGKGFLDLISGISVSNIGHRHPKVVEAIKNQADKYMHQLVYGEFIQSPQVMLADLLVKSLANWPTLRGDVIDNVYFTNSGAEAVEGAMKLAKRFTGRPEIIACHNAYHGSTQGAMSLGEHFYNRSFRPLLPDIGKIERNNIKDIEFITERTAAVIIETIGAESGIVATDLEFMQALAERCKQTDTLLIFDEIQTGLGRTGFLWNFEQYGIVPDILLSAKALGGGLPLGAFMASKRIMSVLKENPILGHITTFGGNPMSCAAAEANLRVILEEIDLEEVRRKGKRIRDIFSRMKGVCEVRGEGLFIAAQVADFAALKANIDYFLSNNIIIDWFLYCDSAMRICPPLNIKDEEIDILEKAVLDF